VHPRDNDLIIATHGRGLYVLDDITPLQQIGSTLASDAALFDLRPTVQYMLWGRDGNLRSKNWASHNPPPGALVSYYLKSATDSGRIVVTNKSGHVVQTLRNIPRNASVNRLA